MVVSDDNDVWSEVSVVANSVVKSVPVTIVVKPVGVSEVSL